MLSNLLYPYPLHGNFKINGVEFDLMDGVFGLAVGPVHNGDRRLFFHSLASVRESWVSTRLLRNESNFGDEHSPAVSKQFQVSEPRRTSQSAAEVNLHHDNVSSHWPLLRVSVLIALRSRDGLL